MERRRLIAGNWKMNGTSAQLGEVNAIFAAAKASIGSVDVALCLPATLIERATHAAPDALIEHFPGPILRIGAQDVHPAPDGAHTGCISAAMLRDAGATITIVGHSERRDAQHETDADVRAKAATATAAGLWTILCVGESSETRDSGNAVTTVCAQLDASLPLPDDFDATHLSVAYEPIWAIGTGKIPYTEDIAEMHAALRQRLVAAYGDAGSAVRILYGGSVKAGNAAAIFAIPDVDGALVGGASLTAADFVPIIEAAAHRAR